MSDSRPHQLQTDTEDSPLSLHLAEHSDLRDREQQWPVLAQLSSCVSSGTTLPSHVPLYYWDKALQVEPNSHKDDGSPSLEVLLRFS